MKLKPPRNIELCRIMTGPLASTESLGIVGSFVIPYKNRKLFVMSSNALGWDHVSVSLKHRVPTWEEMCYVKNLFFEDEETVIQYHPPKSKYINQNKNVLHLWRQQEVEYELPPWWLIGKNNL